MDLTLAIAQSHVEGQHQTGHRDAQNRLPERRVTTYAQIDYALVKRSLDVLERRFARELDTQLRKARATLTKQLKAKGENYTELVGSLRVPNEAGLQEAVLAALQRAWEGGGEAARGEVASVREHTFDPDQPRDPQGKWREVGGAVVAYHGSTEDLIKKIKKEGIQVGKSDRSFPDQNYVGGLYEDKLRRSSVFVTSSKGNARLYAKERIHNHGQRGKPVTFELRIPKGVWKKFKNDEEDAAGKSAFAPLVIKPKWIVGAEVLSPRVGYVPSKKWLAEEGDIEPLFAVIFADGDVKLTQRSFADPSFTPRVAIQWLRQKAFWVTGVLSDQLTDDIRGVLIRALKTGVLLSETLERVAEVFAPYLLTGEQDELLPAHRLETIIRTNTTDAYNHGRLTEFIKPDMMPFLEGIMYSAILDSRTTEVCRFLHEKIFKPDDPELYELVPPNHYNCRSVLVAIVVGTPFDEDNFITPDEIEEAKSLADQKFLSEWSESKLLDLDEDYFGRAMTYAELTEEQRAYSKEKGNCIWRMIRGHPVCISAAKAAKKWLERNKARVALELQKARLTFPNITEWDFLQLIQVDYPILQVFLTGLMDPSSISLPGMTDIPNLVDFVRTAFFEEEGQGWDESKHPRHQKGDDKGGEFAPKGTAGEETLESLQKKVTLEEVHDVLKQGGLKVVRVEDLPAGLLERQPMEVGIPTRETLIAVQGVVDAVKGIPVTNALMKETQRVAQKEMRVAVGGYDPGAFMSLVTGPGEPPFLLINTKGEGVGKTIVIHQQDAWTYPAMQAIKQYNAGLPLGKAMRLNAKLSAYHELGHLADRLGDSELTDSMVHKLRAMHKNDVQKLTQYVKANISPYAATNPRDVTAEAFAMVMDGKNLPKELKSWQDKLR